MPAKVGERPARLTDNEEESVTFSGDTTTGQPAQQDASSAAIMEPHFNGSGFPGVPGPVPQTAVLDFFFPGLSTISGFALRYLGIDLNVYIPLLVLVAGVAVASDYVRSYAWGIVSDHFMSTAEIRVDDEIYNIVMAWVAAQSFAKSSRRFVANTKLSSRSWNLWDWDDDKEEDDDDDDVSPGRKKPLSYTPAFGRHIFWYKRRLLIFQRTQDKEKSRFSASESEEISISCFGRNPWVLKELLTEAKLEYAKKDADNTLIYRGTCRSGGSDPTWQRCLSRASRPLSTVILSEAKKNLLLEDVADYLSPATRRWYSNRGIPYRRGYLLYGPPGTGKSSLSLALAGHFKMRIYIVSLNSLSATEENLSNLFAELPRRCLVLLEDIDTAGLTNTRETPSPAVKSSDKDEDEDEDKADKAGGSSDILGRLSLSGLLNILDGVASQEGRLLIMTTNHLENLDKALIRPGRVDMTIEFGRADSDITASIFTAIYTKMEGDEVEGGDLELYRSPSLDAKQDLGEDEVAPLAQEFASKVPANEFSPAEVQGYLLRHKRSPRDAVANIGLWVEETRKQKQEKGVGQAEEVKFVGKEKGSGAKQESLDEKAAEGTDEEPKEKDGPPADGKTRETESSTPGADTPSSRDSVASEPRTPADVVLTLPTNTKGEEKDGETAVVVN